MNSIILYAIPFFAVLIGLELLVSKRRGQHWYSVKDTVACLTMGTGNVIISLASAAATYALFLLCYKYRLFEFEATAISSWVLLFFAEDFCYYWFHRSHHECRVGWAGHVTHHSSTHYNLAVALRQSWTTQFTGLVFWLPLAFLGFHPLMILTQQALSLIYQYWIHTQAINRLGPLESVLNTPSHHRVHHGSNEQYIDKNYGGFLIIWDRLFGTFEPEDEPVRYGLTKNIDTYNPLVIAFHEWNSMLRDMFSAKKWRDVFGFLLKHPGWQPDAPKHDK